MPSHQKHRGAHPKDVKLFGEKYYAKLSAAVLDLNYLLKRSYGDKAALKIVGDRYKLTKRQRGALSRISCPKQVSDQMKKREVNIDSLAEQDLLIDGFNIIILSEVLLSGGMIFESTDKTYRDIASIHGSYYKVTETPDAIYLIGNKIESYGSQRARWYFDAPVSNSGRLKQYIEQIAIENGWNWEFLVINNPDKALKESENGIILSSDRYILSDCKKWFNISKDLVESNLHLSGNILKLKQLGID